MTEQTPYVVDAWNKVRDEARSLCGTQGFGPLLQAVEAYGDARAHGAPSGLLTDDDLRRLDDETMFHESPDWSVRFARKVLEEAAHRTATSHEARWALAEAQIGEKVTRFIDRMNDLTDEDNANKVLTEFLAAVNPIYDDVCRRSDEAARNASSAAAEKPSTVESGAGAQLPNFPIVYAILRPALASGNGAVRQHVERLAEVLEDDQLAAVRELLDRPPMSEPPTRVVAAAKQPLPGLLGYEPDGPVGMALSWLKSSLSCPAFHWDSDQRECAEQTLNDAEQWVADLMGAHGAYGLPAGQWIAVADLKPQPGVDVLTYPGWGTGGKGFSVDQWTGEHYDCFLMWIEEGGPGPTHWMLPIVPGIKGVNQLQRELDEALDDVTGWLDHYGYAEADVLPSLQRLNAARMRMRVAQRRTARGDAQPRFGARQDGDAREVIALSHDQAHAVSERMTKLRRISKSRGTGLTGKERAVLTVQNPYTTPETHGIYLEIEGRSGSRCPLFAKDLGHERNFEASRLPARDELGHLSHPDMDGVGDDEFDMTPQLRALGWVTAAVSFESDADEDLHDRYYDNGDPDCSKWEPSIPEGEGWLLAAIYETEEGPVALFVKRAGESFAGEGAKP